MSAISVAIQEKVERLSPLRQNELIDFADFLLSKDDRGALAPMGELAVDVLNEEEAKPLPSSPRKLAFDWVIDDDGPPEEVTSVELQHQATQWWVEMAEKNLAQS